MENKDKTKKNDLTYLKWVYLRDGEIRGIFENRREAVKYFKELLKQTLKDFDKQDKTDEFDYYIKIPSMEFNSIAERPTHLGL